jgi:hypothetical protein
MDGTYYTKQHASVPRNRLDVGSAELDPHAVRGEGEAGQLGCREVDKSEIERRLHEEASWTPQDKSAFNLGLYLFGKYFQAIQKLVETKTVRPSHRVT